MKPPKGDNIRPGTAFWLVLIVIGGASVWQKASAPSKPVTDVRTGKNAPEWPSPELSAFAPDVYRHRRTILNKFHNSDPLFYVTRICHNANCGERDLQNAIVQKMLFAGAPVERLGQ